MSKIKKSELHFAVSSFAILLIVIVGFSVVFCNIIKDKNARYRANVEENTPLVKAENEIIQKFLVEHDRLTEIEAQQFIEADTRRKPYCKKFYSIKCAVQPQNWGPIRYAKFLQWREKIEANVLNSKGSE